MSRIFNGKLLLLVILLIAFLLRFYSLDKIPASLSADEAALGYTSFSLLKTGLDIHGNFFPITYSTFGSSWTLIGYPFTDIIPQMFLGLNEFSVRLPSALAGVMGVVLIYLISLTVFKNKRISLFAAMVFAISPWSIYFSRMAYETNLALTFFLGGMFCFLKFVIDEEKKDNLLIYSAILFSLTLFIYYSYVVLLPLFLFALFFLFKNKLFKNKKFYIAVIILIFSILCSFYLTFKNSIGEASTLGIFNDRQIIYTRVERFRTDGSKEPPIVQKLFHNRYLGVSYQLALNYVNSFSPDFLFDKGGNKIVNDIGYFGKLYLIDVLFLFFGFASLFYKKERNLPLLLAWLFISPVSSAITNDAPSSTRLFTLVPLFVLVIAYGMNEIIVFLSNKKLGKALVVLVGGLFLLNFLFFVDLYFVHFNFQRVRFLGYGYKEAVKLSQKYPSSNIVLRGPDNFPYIYFLFYNQYDPNKFREEVKYYPASAEGFYFVQSFGRYSFPWKIDYVHEKSKTVYIDDILNPNNKNKIYLPSGEPILDYYVVN